MCALYRARAGHYENKHLPRQPGSLALQSANHARAAAYEQEMDLRKLRANPWRAVALMSPAMWATVPTLVETQV